MSKLVLALNFKGNIPYCQSIHNYVERPYALFEGGEKSTFLLQATAKRLNNWSKSG